ncbi:hypothetical protein COT78_03175 [Candidatus Berkelbacteria bacterium CG10_big_fil_rev_8_21_14_0_10_43_13]|uniref:HD domain-containing protein n=1 Tax=Candidatus Berkelbacteria bacterium CG10_big_fil_rev_8_21_14_0_10_43_13 TaxID=1974514 RepID=A0A2H0W611_9BACT|nr:MAG: hypothetical protein COT78_03175 [Candidatus Berkelbacteria bacterium CG10_big_fil_rev_8_21_14_0_10_43_13]
MTSDTRNIKKFFSEIQMTKRVKHEGVRLAGVEFPDSIADHSCVAAQIAFVLAELEGCDPFKAAAMNLFHDNHECRIGDHHKISSRYIDSHAAEEKAENEHFSNLSDGLAKKTTSLLNEKRQRNSKEGVIAQDADWLEMAFQAKIYAERGYAGSMDWFKNVEEAVETPSAKKILKLVKEDDDFTNCWWRGLKKQTHKKLESS